MFNASKYFKHSFCKFYKAGAFFLAIIFTFTAMAIPNTTTAQKQTQLTVVKVFDKQADQDFTQIIFLESARFYKLFVNNKRYKAIVALAKKSLKTNTKIAVEFTEPNGDVIKNINLIKIKK